MAPGYSRIIKKPMDLSKIKGRIIKSSYHTFESFDEDMLLMFKNCKTYNTDDTVYYKVGYASSRLRLIVHTRRRIDWKLFTKNENSKCLSLAGQNPRGKIGCKDSRVERLDVRKRKRDESYEAFWDGVLQEGSTSSESLGWAAMILADPFAYNLICKRSAGAIREVIWR